MSKQRTPLDAQPVVASSISKGVSVSPSGRLIPKKQIGDFMNCYGTVTGRWPATKKQTSNEPKHEGNLKQMIAQQDGDDWSCEPVTGGELIALDYSETELRLLASLMKE